jgi:hypothetical protein
LFRSFSTSGDCRPGDFDRYFNKIAQVFYTFQGVVKNGAAKGGNIYVFRLKTIDTGQGVWDNRRFQSHGRGL